MQSPFHAALSSTGSGTERSGTSVLLLAGAMVVILGVGLIAYSRRRSLDRQARIGSAIGPLLRSGEPGVRPGGDG